MPPAIEGLIGACAVFLTGSGGFWVYLRNRKQAEDSTTRLLMGLAHDKIIFFGMRYIDRGWVTSEEFQNLQRYFYEPYKALGGNGSAERIMAAVEILPLAPATKVTPETRAREEGRIIAPDLLIVDKEDADDDHSAGSSH